VLNCELVVLQIKLTPVPDPMNRVADASVPTADLRAIVLSHGHADHPADSKDSCGAPGLASCRCYSTPTRAI